MSCHRLSILSFRGWVVSWSSDLAHLMRARYLSYGLSFFGQFGGCSNRIELLDCMSE